MSNDLSPFEWLNHVFAVDDGEAFLSGGGALIRVVQTATPTAHAQLRKALGQATEPIAFDVFEVSRDSCEKLQYPNKVVSALAKQMALPELFRSCATEVWRRLGYPSVGVTARDVCDAHGVAISQLQADFTTQLRRSMEAGPKLNRDFQRLIPHVLSGVIDGPNQERQFVGVFEAFLTNTLSARELFQLGVQRRVKRETATATMRNLLMMPALAGRRGVVLHLDLRWISDHELVPRTDGVQLAPTRQARIWVYQWLRELIDGLDQFEQTFIIAEFGPTFPDPTFGGRGWGLYDALRLRLQEGVRATDGAQNPSAPFVRLGDR